MGNGSLCDVPYVRDTPLTHLKSSCLPTSFDCLCYLPMPPLLFFCAAKRKVTKEKAGFCNAASAGKNGSTACYVETRPSLITIALVSCLPVEYRCTSSISTSFISLPDFRLTGKGAILTLSYINYLQQILHIKARRSTVVLQRGRVTCYQRV